MRAVLGALEPWQFGWVCTFAGDPHQAAPAVWAGRTYRGTSAQGAILDRAAGQNAYYSAAVLQAAPGGDVQRSKAAFARLAVLLADDMDLDQLKGTPTYILQTSPGKHQVGVIVDPADPDAADIGLVDRVLAEMARRDGRDPAGNACVRFARLPVGINGKAGAAHRVQLLQWNPDQVLTLADAGAVLGIDLDAIKSQPAGAAPVEPREARGARWEELTSHILAGEQLHDSLRDLAAGLVGTGTAPGAAVELLRGLMRNSQAVRDERWQSRLAEIPRLVSSAEKYRPASEPQITVNLGEPMAAANSSRALELFAADDLPAANDGEVFDDELVEGVLGKDATAVLYGDSNTGKTFVAVDLCAAIAQGARWQGRRCEQGVVLYLATESPASVRLRLRAFQRHHRTRLVGFFVVASPVSLFDSEADIAAVIEAARDVERRVGRKVALVVGDTLARLSAGANENSGQDMGIVLRNCDRIRQGTGASFLLIHHTGKDQARGMRGWSGMRAFIDTELEVTVDEATSTRVVEITKQRDLEGKGDRFGFRLQSVPVGITKWGKPRTSAVVVGEVAPAKAPGRSRPMGKVEVAVLEHLQRQPAGVWRKDVVDALSAEAEPTNIYRALRNLAKAGAVHEAAGMVAATAVARQSASDQVIVL